MNAVLDLTRTGGYTLALLPEIVLCAWAMLVLIVDVAQKGNRSQASRPSIGWLALVGIVVTAVATGALWNVTATAGPAMMSVDRFRVFIDLVILGSAALALLMAQGYLDRRGINRGEFQALVMFSTAGMLLMAGARDLLMVFIGLELLSIPIYCLVGFDRLDERSVEGALKYFLLGAFSSAFFLFGIALTWGATGTTDIPLMGQLILGRTVEVSPMLLAGMAMLMVGFGFKVAAMPFHMWTPDAYDGAPTPVTSLMSTGVKAAAFASFIRVFVIGFGGAPEHWQAIGFWIAIVTMAGANLIAMTEGSLKRMLAYSSIAHAGYLLVALLSNSADGAAAFLFYLLVYTLMTAGAFALLIANSREATGEERVSLEDWAGFAREKPLLAGLFSIFLLSLAGFPLTAGFLGKLYILRAAIASGLTPLAVVLVLTSLLSYFYYLRVIVVMYMQPARVAGEHRAARLPGPAMAAVGVAAALVVLLFFAGGWPLRWAERSANSLWPAEWQQPAAGAAPAADAPGGVPRTL
ncbi:NADH-quinone oxidoreductase subunit N [Longimicrobium sp.]|uniref:NADH-quinone oxidoreductase subunit N n=1 Tax=Longimicrobium sp. TaxID=2029185 RepID=UPI002CE77D56|nr:NADH-quinone oxidoreductase subunit N [Longimicrobium sp.]HSU14648.1 NADH-quinone oxidoreductase subunit N [Longimicrobium sp.]